ncbi:MAG: Fic family protein, partial [Proteobacteria bacterium]|nr:Fic family protein [Pseudomonadota bacterium]
MIDGDAKILAPLPPDIDFETVELYKNLARANRALGELKGVAKSMPSQGILLNTLIMQDALASSKIENIVSTQDEAFSASLFANTGTVEAKEVARCLGAMRLGYDIWRETNSISERMIIDMFRLLKQSTDGYRQTPGTVLRNLQTGRDVYRPPQDPQKIITYMRELVDFINADIGAMDPLIKMALIHHQFESIHPFSDGNGRVGRMLNVLYLSHTGLLDMPILHLSRAISHTRPEYYRLLQAVRDEGAWERWVIYMLKAVTQTADSTLRLVNQINDLMQTTKHRLRAELPKIYSQDLLNNLFCYPYTKIDYMKRDINAHYNTAA